MVTDELVRAASAVMEITASAKDAAIETLPQMYFGWVDDYDSSWDAVADFVVTADDPQVRLAHDELVNLLARGLADVDLDAAVNDNYRSGYIPESEGLTLRQFVAQLELELRPSTPA